jgi:hypothetical protein
MFCFSDRQPGSDGPRRISQGEIRDVFSDGWRVDEIAEATITTLTFRFGAQAPGLSHGRAPRAGGGETAFRRERSGLPQASPETPLAFRYGECQ